jgi:hypothetical protein
MLTCELSDPRITSLDGEVITLVPPTDTNQNFQFMAISCNDDRTELVQNATTGAEFYIQKTLTYGEGLTIIFLTIFLIGVLTMAIYNFIFKND